MGPTTEGAPEGCLSARGTGMSGGIGGEGSGESGATPSFATCPSVHFRFRCFVEYSEDPNQEEYTVVGGVVAFDEVGDGVVGTGRASRLSFFSLTTGNRLDSSSESGR